MVLHHPSARSSLALQLTVLVKLYSEGLCLKEAHFFLKEAKLLLSNAICFSISGSVLFSILFRLIVITLFESEDQVYIQKNPYLQQE